MPESGQYDPRLSELTWRSVKLRISILILSIFTLLTTWSSLEVGNRKAPDVDQSYCLRIADNSQKLMNLQMQDFAALHPELPRPEDEALSAADYCARVLSKRDWILFQKAEMAWLLTAAASLESPSEKELATAISKELSDYETRRSEAFRIDFKLAAGYSENDVEANALSVAAAVPFIVIGLLVLYFMLGHQEAGWASLLREELDRESSGGRVPPDLFAAKSQYFVSPRDRVRAFWFPGFLRSPDKFAKAVLLLSTIYLLFAVTSEFAGELNSFTDSIFEGYSFWLCAAAFFAIVVIAISRHYCSATGLAPISNRLVALPGADESGLRPVGRWKFLRRIRRPMSLALVGGAFACLFMPWAHEDFVLPWRHQDSWGAFIFGYEWLLRHDPSSRWIGSAGREMNLTIFREVRLEILTALAFLALCLFCEVAPRWRWARAVNARDILRILRNFFAVIILFLSFDYLVFMVVLEEEVLSFSSSLYARGGSMLYYSPAFGYWIFSALCVALSALSLSGLDATP